MRERQLGRKSAQVSKRQTTISEPAPWKLLLWTAIAGLVFGLIGFGEIAEDYLRICAQQPSSAPRQRRHRPRPDRRPVASSRSAIGPGRRQQDAALVDRLNGSGAKRIFLDINLSFPSTHEDDTALADALQRSGRVTLFARSRGRTAGTSQAHRWPTAADLHPPRKVRARHVLLQLSKCRLAAALVRQSRRARRCRHSPQRWPTGAGRRTRLFRSIIRSRSTAFRRIRRLTS